MTEIPAVQTFAGAEVLVIVSYASGMSGFSPSEWVSDKLEVLRGHKQRTILITSSASQLESSRQLTVIKIPSLSHRDFMGENSLASSRNIESSQFNRGLHALISATLGRIFDFLFRLVAGQNSDGRWSWFITSLPVVLYHCLKNPSTLVFATGGPSSAHFSSVLAGILSRRKVVLEFQDPFIGSEMHLIDRTDRAMSWVEGFLISNATKTVFVTEAAAASAKARNPKFAHKVVAIYPGAWPVSDPPQQPLIRSETFTFLHLGTLYSTRDLDSFLKAVLQFRSEGGRGSKQILIHNMGEIALPQIDDYFATGIFKQTHMLPRHEALSAAAKSDCLLLVQHNDTRSWETIPYKFYDYLNLGLRIFGIVKSEELRDLIKANGGYACEQGDVASAVRQLERLFEDVSSSVVYPKRLGIEISKQFKLALVT